MTWKHTFRQVDASPSLVEYAEDRLERTAHLLLKDSSWHVYYSMGKYDYQVEVVVSNPSGHFKATARSIESLYLAVDEVAHKISKQFQKKKELLKSHKSHDRSKQGQIERVNERLEYDNRPFYNKKPA